MGERGGVKKLLIPLLLSLLLSSTALADLQWRYDAGEQFPYEMADDYAVLTGYDVENSTPEETLIPDTVGGLPLREIGANALNNW